MRKCLTSIAVLLPAYICIRYSSIYTDHFWISHVRGGKIRKRGDIGSPGTASLSGLHMCLYRACVTVAILGSACQILEKGKKTHRYPSYITSSTIFESHEASDGRGTAGDDEAKSISFFAPFILSPLPAHRRWFPFRTCPPSIRVHRFTSAELCRFDVTN
ncbi:hypothetical protein F4804DRAFT_91541 [Jackrogersella minutella]|nr:hypothetical protein F4804DRAFT_91541 [Jackrogersella minutella]